MIALIGAFCTTQEESLPGQHSFASLQLPPKVTSIRQVVTRIWSNRKGIIFAAMCSTCGCVYILGVVHPRHATRRMSQWASSEREVKENRLRRRRRRRRQRRLWCRSEWGSQSLWLVRVRYGAMWIILKIIMQILFNVQVVVIII